MTKIVLKSDASAEESGRPEIRTESVFEAKILSVEDRETKWWATEYDSDVKLLDENGEPYKTREYNFKFELQDPEFPGRWVWGSTSQAFSMKPNCKLANWIKSILDEPVLPEGFSINITPGVDPDTGEEVESDLVGLNCRVVVKARKRDDGSYSNWVSDVHPTKVPSGSVQERVQEHLAGNDEAPAEAEAYNPADEPF